MSYANKSEAAVNDCIVKFAPLVKRLAHYMMASLPPSVELDDVIQSGTLGLLDAARRFQDGLPVFKSFEGFSDFAAVRPGVRCARSLASDLP